MIERSDFFEFKSRFASSTVQVGAVSLRDPATVGELDEDRLSMGDYSGIVFPVVFRHEYGRKWCDVLDTGTPTLMLISERIKGLLEEHGLTGWGTFAVRILGKKGSEVFGYHGFSTLGRCGPVDCTQGEVIEKRLVPTGPLVRYRRGLHVGVDRWDGSDFCLPENYLGTIVTRRAAEVLKASKLTNVELNNLADMEIAEENWIYWGLTPVGDAQ